eukprot:gene7000-14241_t
MTGTLIFEVIIALSLTFAIVSSVNLRQNENIEYLMYKYRVEEAKDDYGYSALYMCLFDSISSHIWNVTEIKSSAGPIINVWMEYFTNANIYGVNLNLNEPKLKNNNRIVYLKTPNIHSITENSMDIIFADSNSQDINGGLSSRFDQENTLKIYWKYIKPGGYYIIENVDALQGGLDFQEHPERLLPYTREIFNNNHVFLVDSHIGHRDWSKWKSITPNVIDHHMHNSYLIVIRKRIGEISPILVSTYIRTILKKDKGVIKTSNINNKTSQNNIISSKNIEFLEHLMYKYRTDKGKDDHGYSSIYSSLFDPIRFKIKNFLEIGIAMGKSLQVWHDYFINAKIIGIDNEIHDIPKFNLQSLTRIELILCDVLDTQQTNKLLLKNSTMDIIIDDGPHHRQGQETTLRHFWRFLKPGGYYIMEDVDAQRDGLDFQEHPERLLPYTREIFNNNHVFLVDSHIGHRDWSKWKEASGRRWVQDHRIHNSYVIVIRKRIGNVPPIQMSSVVKNDH